MIKNPLFVFAALSLSAALVVLAFRNSRAPEGYLDFDSDFTNGGSDLTVISGGMLLLDQEVTVGSATINGQALAEGVYTGADLKANATFGSAFDAATTDSSRLIVGNPTPFAFWLADNPDLAFTSFTADGDGDGIANGIEYVFGGDAAPGGQIVPQWSVSGTDLLFAFDRNAVATTDTTQTFQYSADLSTWVDVSLADPVSSEVSIGAAVDGVESISITIDNTTTAYEDLFWRLKAELNE